MATKRRLTHEARERITIDDLEASFPKPPETDFVVLGSDAYTTETQRECGSGGGFSPGPVRGHEVEADWPDLPSGCRS